MAALIDTLDLPEFRKDRPPALAEPTRLMSRRQQGAVRYHLYRIPIVVGGASRPDPSLLSAAEKTVTSINVDTGLIRFVALSSLGRRFAALSAAIRRAGATTGASELLKTLGWQYLMLRAFRRATRRTPTRSWRSRSGSRTCSTTSRATW
jgi:hypothetical protein